MQGLTCPCTQSRNPLATISNWSWAADAFCVGVLSALRSAPDFLASLLDQDSGSLNAACSADFPRLLSDVTAVITATRMLDPGDPAFAADAEAVARRVERGLCGLAFGTTPIVPDFYPIDPPPSTRFGNHCDNQTNAERRFFVPETNGMNHATEPAIQTLVQLQQTRLRTLLMESIDTCITLEGARASFLAAAAELPLKSTIALPPFDVGPAVEGAFAGLLEERASRLLALTPGFTPDALFSFTEVAAPAAALGPLGRAAAEFSAAGLPLSTRLPFVRTDFIAGGGRAAFTTARFEPNRALGGAGFPLPLFAWEARAMRDVAPARAAAQRFIDPAFITPGFVAGAAQSSGAVPLGDDMLSLLDACTEGARVSVDVHNARPLAHYVGIQYSGVAGGFTNASLYTPPFNKARVWGFASANAFCWSGGAGFSPPAPGSGEPQRVLFNAPLTCPPLATWMGGLRRNSTYFNASSPVRLTIGQWLTLFNVSAADPKGVPASPSAAQRAALDALREGDLADRIGLLSNLMFEAQGATFSHNERAYYERCAPSVCTYTSILPRSAEEVAVEAVSLWGGTTATVLMFLGLLSYWLSVARHYCEKRRGRAGEGGGKAAGDVAIAGNPLVAMEIPAWGEKGREAHG